MERKMKKKINKKQEPNWRKRFTIEITKEQRLICMEWEYEGKRKQKTYDISRGKESHFERIEEEEVLRVRDENKVNTGKK